MYWKENKKVKVVSADTADEFESKLNSVLCQLNKDRAKYELQLNPTAGLLAFITYTEQEQVPETLADEFDLLGERHVCSECPFFEKIMDGRVKHSRCTKTGRVERINTPCCDTFYELLMKGELNEID